MRDYGKVSPKFWTGKTGKAIKEDGIEATLVAMYLMTSPHADMLGIYYLPIVYIAHDTGLSIGGASKGLKSCIDANFCAYDPLLELVWVIKMAEYQIAPSLKESDNQVKAVHKAFLELPECQHLQAFYQFYKDKFHLPVHSFFLPPSKPLRSQEQEQEQEHEQEHEQENISPEVKTSRPPSKRKKQDDITPKVIEFPLNVTGTYHGVTQASVDQLQELYPATDVLQELRKMLGWLNANPKKRKTKTGIDAFINRWLAKQQDGGRIQPGTATAPADASGFGEYRPSIFKQFELDNAKVIEGERVS